MNKLLIVDDEILVQVGIKSMLSQTALNVQVCGTARNGQIALDLIEEHSPDIVITDMFSLQSQDLKLDFHYAGYVCCYGEIVSAQADALPRENQLSLFASSLQMIRELVPKYMPCYALSLDMQHFALIFCYESLPQVRPVGEKHAYFEEINDILTHVSSTLQNYYSVSLQCGVGSLVATPFAVSDSYQYSRQAYQVSSPARPIAFFSSWRMPERIIPSISAFSRGISAKLSRNMTRTSCCGLSAPSANCFPRTPSTMCRPWTPPATSCTSPSPHCPTAKR